MKTEKATFGAGCFWHVEDAFRKVPGVVATASGFMGGHVENPSYERVCRGDTGHAEVVQLEFDQEKVSYEKLLEVFWGIHNPTQLNRQGPDIGYQYRSAIFYHNEKQRQLAEKSKQELENSGRLSGKIVTAIEPAKKFFKAEEYHQRYIEKHGKGVCPA